MKMIGIFLITLFFVLTSGCPTPESIYPCTCVWPGTEDAFVTCSNLDNEHDLVKAASSLTTRSYVYSFVIQNSVMTYIPSDAFKGVKFTELEIKDSTLMSLTDKDVAFEGLEKYLAFLIITNSTLMNGWDWTVLKKLKELTRLDINYVSLEIIEDLGQINISKIMDINFSHNVISFVHPFAFASFKSLMHLSLADNSIRTLHRAMLPNPASELRILDISYNEIEQFPSDMFIAMPSLETLSIAHNKLLVLEKLFSPVWERLLDFTAMDNELRCDCRMSWILESRFPENARAICAQPPELKGKSITQLSSKDLWCYH